VESGAIRRKGLKERGSAIKAHKCQKEGYPIDSFAFSSSIGALGMEKWW